MQRRINPREANRMMQRMGMQLKQIDDVTRVVIESATKKIIIDEPEVAIVTVQGQTVYQVGGEEREKKVQPVQAQTKTRSSWPHRPESPPRKRPMRSDNLEETSPKRSYSSNRRNRPEKPLNS